MTKFNEGLSETITLKDLREAFPAFATALVNSQRLLPQDEALSLAQINAISETWRGER